MKKMKGQLASGISGILMLVIIGVFVVVGVSMMETFENDQSANINATAANASLGLLEISENLELLGLIIIMAVVIAVLMASFGGFVSGGI